MRTRLADADAARWKDRRHRAVLHFKFLILNMIFSTFAAFRQAAASDAGLSPDRRGTKAPITCLRQALRHHPRLLRAAY
jgi:hypothetical protein